ncbi:MAG: prepilin-type N-terminal cleavage/methylation domain-containing protein [Lachnospiraceae bacterium]|nr:prepilin-type N-terminal cleavage/methylation domain-containing protein [Lachnospiraceae bacterium]
MKRGRQCEDGFTMVEMIITIAVSAILVGTIVATLGYISAGNAKRSAARFNSKLNTAQTETMMQAKPTYLYLFVDGGVKAVLSKEEYTTSHELKNKVSTGVESATDVGGSRVTVSLIPDDGSPASELNDTNMLRIAFKKATGAYEYTELEGGASSTFFEEIEFAGGEKFKVTLVKATGKHVMSK